MLVVKTVSFDSAFTRGGYETRGTHQMSGNVNKHTRATGFRQTQRSHYSCQLASISINRPFSSPSLLFSHEGGALSMHFEKEKKKKHGIYAVRISAACAIFFLLLNEYLFSTSTPAVREMPQLLPGAIPISLLNSRKRCRGSRPL